MSTLGVPFSCLLLQGAAQEGAQSDQNGGPTQATSGPRVASIATPRVLGLLQRRPPRRRDSSEPGTS